ncbi:MAG: glycosyltransferase family 4 protein [Verrucomicrobiota bacterium]
MLGYLILESDPRVLREAAALQENGWEVEVISLGQDGRRKSHTLPNGVTNHQVRTPKYRGDSTLSYCFSYFRFALEAMMMVLRLGMKKRYSAVHVHTMPDLLILCALPIKLWGTPVVLDVHDTVPEVYQDKFNCSSSHPLIQTLRWCEKFAVRFADEVITVNHEHSDLVRKRSGLKKDPHIIFNAVDLETFKERPKPEKRPLTRLIVHGTLSHRHGLDVLLDAFPRVLEAEPDTVLNIYGNGDAVPALREKIQSLGLGDSVHLSGKYHPLEEMAGYVRNADIGIIPYRKTHSTQYMLPTKLLEYLAVGLAVVTCETLPVRSMFEGSLKIWDDGDPDSLADLIIEQIRQPVFPELPDEMRWNIHQKSLTDLYSNLQNAA